MLCFHEARITLRPRRRRSKAQLGFDVGVFVARIVIFKNPDYLLGGPFDLVYLVSPRSPIMIPHNPPY